MFGGADLMFGGADLMFGGADLMDWLGLVAIGFLVPGVVLAFYEWTLTEWNPTKEREEDDHEHDPY